MVFKTPLPFIILQNQSSFGIRPVLFQLHYWFFLRKHRRLQKYGLQTFKKRPVMSEVRTSFIATLLSEKKHAVRKKNQKVFACSNLSPKIKNR